MIFIFGSGTYVPISSTRLLEFLFYFVWNINSVWTIVFHQIRIVGIRSYLWPGNYYFLYRYTYRTRKTGRSKYIARLADSFAASRRWCWFYLYTFFYHNFQHSVFKLCNNRKKNNNIQQIGCNLHGAPATGVYATSNKMDPFRISSRLKRVISSKNRILCATRSLSGKRSVEKICASKLPFSRNALIYSREQWA